MKITLKSALTLLACSTVFEASAAPWTDYIGTHYSTSWTSTVRTPTDVGAAYGATLSYEKNLANFKPANLPKYGTAVLMAFGGKEQTTVLPFLDAVAVDGGVAMRAHMAAKGLATVGMNNVYWQLGNEINNNKLSESIHVYLKDGKTGTSTDLTIIPTYAEQWFAPLAAGLRQGNPNAKLILGSVVNAATTESQAFIKALLDYKLVGTYAPSLAGKKVSEVINVGSIHYSMQTGAWEKPLQLFADRGISVWSTEEIGARSAESGTGMVRAVKVLGNAFDWWLNHGTSPDNGKVFLWGAALGADLSIDKFMPELSTFLANGELEKDTSATVTGINVQAKTYRVKGTGKRIVFITPSGSKGQIATITGITGAQTGLARAYRSTGMSSVSVLPDASGKATFDIPLTGEASVVITMGS
jgi:hypothetical protein